MFLKMTYAATCFLWPLDAVLSSDGLCGTEGDPSFCVKLNRSENYMLLGFLLVLLLQAVLLLVRQTVTPGNISISVFYHSFSKVITLREKKMWTIETHITLFKRVELCQETIQSEIMVLPFFVEYKTPRKQNNVSKLRNTRYLASEQQYSDSVCF